VTAALAPAEYRIVEAHDGEETLRLARTERPDLILLDMMMPALSGVEVLRELRADADRSRTPVIILTARAQASDRAAAARAGADEFVTKPFSPRHLARVVDEMLDGGP
jgi:DNA-binding response OmpR family regulator